MDTPFCRRQRPRGSALLEGQIERGRVGQIVGLSGSWARRIIRLALREGLLDSPSEKGPLSLVFSSKTVESYFPNLYQDLPVVARSAATGRYNETRRGSHCALGSG